MISSLAGQLWQSSIAVSYLALALFAALLLPKKWRNPVLVDRWFSWAGIIGVYGAAAWLDIKFNSQAALMAITLLVAGVMFFELFRLSRPVAYLSSPFLGAWAFFVANSGGAGIAFFIVVAAFDIGGWVGGKTLARFKPLSLRLMPKASPNKTLAGLVGSLALSSLVALVVFAPLKPSQAWVFFGLTCVLAFLGDWLESKFKRFVGVKDVAQHLPGFGGFLDRFDSFLLVGITLLSWIPSVLNN
jgi:phosphatidate cytidylyltransferase